MVIDLAENIQWDRADPRNHGVTADRLVKTREGHLLRLVTYTDPATGEQYEFLTNEPDLPGVLVELYRRRWEAEKVFDEIKNKLGEQKAWATRLAKRLGVREQLRLAGARSLVVSWGGAGG